MHADHGVQFTSCAFPDKVRGAGLMPSFASVGDTLDNARMELFGHGCTTSSSTASAGPRAFNCPTRCSNTSKSSTTAVAGTLNSTMFLQSNTYSRSNKNPLHSTETVEPKRAAGQASVSWKCSRPPDYRVKLPASTIIAWIRATNSARRCSPQRRKDQER